MIGKTISHYKILEKLGRGGMGIVYKAEDTKLKRTVALKFLPPHLTRNETDKARFSQEARAAAALNHPNVCTIHEIHDEGEMPFIVMEYVEGKTLRETVGASRRGGPPLHINDVINIAIQIAEALKAAHKKGIVHRDIKSENIMVTETGQVKVMDFGLAKLSGAVKLTKTSSTLGTVAYMSPEQARGDEVDYRTDIWSLGVVLFEMLTGKLPFKGDYEQAIIYSILNEEPRLKEEISKSFPAPLITLLEKSLRKDITLRTASASEFKTELEQINVQITGIELKRTGKVNRTLKPAILIPMGLVILTASVILVSKIYRMNRIRWAKDVALPNIEELISTGGTGVNNIEAYHLARKADKYIPNEPLLKRTMQQITGIITIKTQPPGAKVFRKPFNKVEKEWEYIGVSPIDSMVMPKYLFNWKFEKPGYDILYRQFWSRGPRDWSTGNYLAGIQECIMEKEDALPRNMVRIPGTGNIPDFFIDKYEVTNKQFKQFMDSRGYLDKTYWKIPFIKNNRRISWEEALAEFLDATDRVGPALWEGGSYPEGEDNLPVNGVSWFEAAAYAEFAGKDLPTVDHWDAASRGRLGMFYHLLFPMCNFNGKGPVSIGTTKAFTQFGVYDMAGNVREWCWNETEKGRCIQGGAWNDVHYMYGTITQADPFDRSDKNGIRCVIYPEKEKVPERTFASIKTGKPRDFYKETPVSDPIFNIYKDMFLYDKMDLKAAVEETNEQSPHWIHQKITFSAAYGNERIIIHLFLPKNISSPCQTVIYFPGSGSIFVPSSDGIEDYNEFPFNLSYLVKNGRAVVYPVYKGTFERRDGIPGSTHFLYDESHEFKDYVVKIVKDFKRVIDYLETRPDLDTRKLAYYGFSWGGILGSLIPAVEERIKISIINAGGLEMYERKTKPEVDHINYVSRVTIPTLMLHGRFDTNVSYDKAARPMFDLLGTQEKDKKLIVYETDHIIPRKELIKESLDWLDRYFGPVE